MLESIKPAPRSAFSELQQLRKELNPTTAEVMTLLVDMERFGALKTADEVHAFIAASKKSPVVFPELMVKEYLRNKRIIGAKHGETIGLINDALKSLGGLVYIETADTTEQKSQQTQQTRRLANLQNQVRQLCHQFPPNRLQ